MAFSPDGKILASASDDKTIRIWNVQRSRTLCILKGHLACVEKVAFSLDSRMLASDGADGLLKFWDAKTNTEIVSLKH